MTQSRSLLTAFIIAFITTIGGLQHSSAATQSPETSNAKLKFQRKPSSLDALTASENAHLERVKNRVLTHLDQVVSDSNQWQRCFEGSPMCSRDLTIGLDQARATIRFKVWEYRRLTGLLRSDLLERDHTAIVPFAGVPTVHLTLGSSNDSLSEFHEVLQLRSEDRNVARTRFEKTYNDRLKEGDPDLLDKSSERSLYMSYAAEQMRMLYQRQVETILSEMPFIAYIDSASPTDKEIAAGLAAMTKAAKDRKQTLMKITGSDRGKFLLLSRFAEAEVSANPSVKAVHEKLLAETIENSGVFGLTKTTEKNLSYAYLACAFVWSTTPLWPIGVTCGSLLLTLNTGRVYENWKALRETRQNWLAGMEPVSKVQKSHDRLMHSVVMASLAYYQFSRLPAAIINGGPISEALQNTFQGLSENLVNFDALANAAYKVSYGYAKKNLQSEAAKALITRRDYDGDTKVAYRNFPILIASPSETGPEPMVLRTGVLLTYAEIDRMLNSLEVAMR